MLAGPMPWDGVLSDQEETPPDTPRGFLRANSQRASPPAKPQRQEKEKDLNASISDPAHKEKESAGGSKPAAQNSLGAKWLDDLSKKVNSTQWIEPVQRQANRAGIP